MLAAPWVLALLLFGAGSPRWRVVTAVDPRQMEKKAAAREKSGHVRLEGTRALWILDPRDAGPHAPPSLTLALRDVRADWYKRLGIPAKVVVSSLGAGAVPAGFHGTVILMGRAAAAASGECVGGERRRRWVEEQHAVRVTTSGGSVTVVAAVGCDARAQVFAAYAFSEHVLGVEPLYWWLGVDGVDYSPSWTIADARYESGPPTFGLRGVFTNDEDLLGGFRADPLGDSVFSAETWNRIIEAVLRLKGNLIIPGTVASADEACYAVAKRRGVIVSQQHFHILGVNTFRWPAGVPFAFDASPEIQEAVWRWSVDAYANRETVWAVGYRGLNDYPFWHDNPDKFNTTEKRASLVSAALHAQVRIIRSTPRRGDDDAILYLWSEMLDLLPSLDVPRGVTRVFADLDGSGAYSEAVYANLRPGDGAYFHVQMESPGRLSQLTEMVPPATFFQAAQRFVDAKATKIFIVNLSDMKPCLFSVDYVLRYLWTGPADDMEPPPEDPEDHRTREEVPAASSSSAKEPGEEGPGSMMGKKSSSKVVGPRWTSMEEAEQQNDDETLYWKEVKRERLALERARRAEVAALDAWSFRVYDARFAARAAAVLGAYFDIEYIRPPRWGGPRFGDEHLSKTIVDLLTGAVSPEDRGLEDFLDAARSNAAVYAEAINLYDDMVLAGAARSAAVLASTTLLHAAIHHFGALALNATTAAAAAAPHSRLAAAARLKVAVEALDEVAAAMRRAEAASGAEWRGLYAHDSLAAFAHSACVARTTHADLVAPRAAAAAAASKGGGKKTPHQNAPVNRSTARARHDFDDNGLNGCNLATGDPWRAGTGPWSPWFDYMFQGPTNHFPFLKAPPDSSTSLGATPRVLCLVDLDDDDAEKKNKATDKDGAFRCKNTPYGGTFAGHAWITISTPDTRTRITYSLDDGTTTGASSSSSLEEDPTRGITCAAACRIKLDATTVLTAVARFDDDSADPRTAPPTLVSRTTWRRYDPPQPRVDPASRRKRWRP